MCRSGLYTLCWNLLIPVMASWRASLFYLLFNWKWTSPWSNIQLEKDHPPCPGGNALLNAARDDVGHLCCKGVLLAHVQLFHQDLRSLSAKPLPSQLPSSLYWCTGLLLPRWRTLHFPVLNLNGVCVSPSAHSVEVPLHGSTVSRCHLHFVPPSWSLVGSLSSCGSYGCL